MSHRLNVLKALTAHLKGITPQNGYDFDLSSAVFRGRHKFGENDPETMVSILEAPQQDKSMFGGDYNDMRVDQWRLLVQGWTTDDIENPTDPLYGLLDNVENRLFAIIAEKGDGSGKPADPAAYMLGGLIANMKYGPGIVRPPTEQVSSKAFFWLPVTITLAVPGW